MWDCIMLNFFDRKRLRRKRAKFECRGTNWGGCIVPTGGLKHLAPTYRAATLPNAPIAFYLASSAIPKSLVNRRFNDTHNLDRAKIVLRKLNIVLVQRVQMWK